MANVKIDITVDVTKLLKVQPGGGKISDQSIVSMNQTGGFFDPATQNTAKLITKAEIGTKIKWKIKSGTTSDNLDLGDYVPEDRNMLSVFIAKPGKVADDEIDGDIIATKPTQNFKTQYTLSFCLKKNPVIVWTWDPWVEYPQPPI